MFYRGVQIPVCVQMGGAEGTSFVDMSLVPSDFRRGAQLPVGCMYVHTRPACHSRATVETCDRDSIYG